MRTISHITRTHAYTYTQVANYEYFYCFSKKSLELLSVRSFFGTCRRGKDIFLDGYCSTVQGLLDWFEVDLGFTELLFIQIHLCVMCVFSLLPSLTLLLSFLWTSCICSYMNENDSCHVPGRMSVYVCEGGAENVNIYTYIYGHIYQ